MNFRIQLSTGAIEDIQWFKKYERTLILDAIDRHLIDQPNVQTRNRKCLRTNILSQWELRVDKYRVLYCVNDAEAIVDIAAVGYKEHDKLFFRGREFKL